MSYIIRPLSLLETSAVYTRWMAHHFPPDELKPFTAIRYLWERGQYRALGLFQDNAELDHLVAYALFVTLGDDKLMLLDYFAVVDDARGRGLGSYFIQHMPDALTGCLGYLIETEDAAFAESDAEQLIRQRRDVFYRRNGAQLTAVRSTLFGVHYSIWLYPLRPTAQKANCREELIAIYRAMLPPEFYDRYVEIS